MLILWFVFVGVISIIMTELAFGTGIKCSIVGSCLCGVSVDALTRFDGLKYLRIDLVLGMLIRMPGIPVRNVLI